MALVEVKVPDIGDFEDVEVIELLVKPGDTVKAEQSLITVESDKASMEIPSSHAGVVKELQGQARRQGQRRLAAADARGRRRGGRRRPAARRQCRGAGAGRQRRGAGGRSRRPPPAAAAAAAARPRRRRPMAAVDVEVVVPDIGDFDEVAVIEVMVKPGDTSRSSRA